MSSRQVTDTVTCLHLEILTLRESNQQLKSQIALSSRKLTALNKSKRAVDRDNLRLSGQLAEAREALAQAQASAAEQAARSSREIRELEEAHRKERETTAAQLAALKSREDEHSRIKNTLQALSESYRSKAQEFKAKYEAVLNSVAALASQLEDLVVDHTESLGPMYQIDMREVKESTTRLFKNLMSPVSHPFHRRLFNITNDDGAGDFATGGCSLMEDVLRPHASSTISSAPSASNSRRSPSDDEVMISTKLVRNSVDAEGLLWMSIRRGMLDFWKIDMWDTMRLSAHALYQMLYHYIETQAVRAENCTSFAERMKTVDSLRGVFLNTEPVGTPASPASPAAPSSSSPGREILNTLELRAARHCSPWFVNVRVVGEKHDCGGGSRDSPVTNANVCRLVEDPSMADQRLWLQGQGVYAFDIGAAYVFRFVHPPLHKNMGRASNGVLGYHIEDLWPHDLGTVDRDQKSVPCPATPHPCMHTDQLITALSHDVSVDMIPPHLRSGYLLRLCSQFSLSSPHIFMINIFANFRQYMLDKHRTATMNHVSDTIRKIVAAHKHQGLAGAANHPPIPDFYVPSVNFPASLIVLPSVLRMAIVKARMFKKASWHDATVSGLALQLSRQIRVRVYCSYNDEPNIWSMESMEDWIQIMEQNKSKQDDYKVFGLAGGSKFSESPHRFVFAYAHRIALGLHIHAFAIVPTSISHRIDCQGMIRDSADVVMGSLCKTIRMVKPLSAHTTPTLWDILWDDDQFGSALKKFHEEVLSAVHRAVHSNLLVRLSTGTSRVDN